MSTDGLTETWEDIVQKVSSMWTGKSNMDESRLGLLVANAVTNYMGGVVLIGDGIEDDFECFIVDSEKLERCAHVGNAKPHINVIAHTVVSMMNMPKSIVVNDEWKKSVEMRFIQPYEVAWVLLSVCKDRNLLMLLVPKKVVSWWTDTMGGKMEECPAGIARKMKEEGWMKNHQENPYINIVPFDLAKMLVVLKRGD